MAEARAASISELARMVSENPKTVRAAIKLALRALSEAKDYIDYVDGAPALRPRALEKPLGRPHGTIRKYLLALEKLGAARRIILRRGPTEYAAWVIDTDALGRLAELLEKGGAAGAGTKRSRPRSRCPASGGDAGELGRELEKARKAAERLKREAKRLAEERDRLRERLRELEESLREAEAAREEAEELRRRLAELAERAEALRRENEALKSALAAARERAKRLARERAELARRLAEAEGRLRALERELRGLAGVRARAERVAELERENRELRARIAELEAENRELRRENEELRSRVEGLEKEIMTLRSMLGLTTEDYERAKRRRLASLAELQLGPDEPLPEEAWELIEEAGA